MYHPHLAILVRQKIIRFPSALYALDAIGPATPEEKHLPAFTWDVPVKSE